MNFVSPLSCDQFHFDYRKVIVYTETFIKVRDELESDGWLIEMDAEFQRLENFELSGDRDPRFILTARRVK